MSINPQPAGYSPGHESLGRTILLYQFSIKHQHATVRPDNVCVGKISCLRIDGVLSVRPGELNYFLMWSKSTCNIPIITLVRHDVSLVSLLIVAMSSQDAVFETVPAKLLADYLTHTPPVFIFLQFVADGIFKAELNEFLTRELAEDGYSGVEVRVTPTRTEIIILATRWVQKPGHQNHRTSGVLTFYSKIKVCQMFWPQK